MSGDGDRDRDEGDMGFDIEERVISVIFGDMGFDIEERAISVIFVGLGICSELCHPFNKEKKRPSADFVHFHLGSFCHFGLEFGF